MLCDRSTPSYRSSFTLTPPQPHADTSSSYTLKTIINHQIQVKAAGLKVGVSFYRGYAADNLHPYQIIIKET